MSRCRYVGAVVAGCLLITAGGVFADTYYVPDDYDTIQEAIVAVNDGDEIAVRPGTYNETINFLGKAVRLYGIGGPEVTTIDGTGLNAYVVKCITREGPDTVLEGFMITGGLAFGGMINQRSSPTILECVFRENAAGQGGGAMLNNQADPTVDRCTFLDNVAIDTGGAMWNAMASPTIRDCLFEGNEASFGGAIKNDAGEPIILRCVFRQNTARNNGGAILSEIGSRPLVTNSTFMYNDARYAGGAIYNNGSHAVITNSTLLHNTVVAEGGGMFSVNGSLPHLRNSIVWANTPNQIVDADTSSSTVTYSDVEGGHDGAGNIDRDPLCESERGQAWTGSPCIDAGDNTVVPEGTTVDLDGRPRFVNDPCTPDTWNPDGLNHPVDMGAFEYQPPCPADLNCSDEIEFGDLLSILSAWNCTGPCLEDLDGDGMVGFSDVLVVLTEWGQPCLCEVCGPADDCGRAPLGGDGFYSFSNRNMTTDGPDLPPGCDEGNGLLFRNDVWMKYMALCDGTVMASVCDSDFDTRMAVYEYSEDECPGTFIACSDDACGDNGTRSEVSFPVESGGTYLIRIGARFAVGEGTLVIECLE